MSRARRRRVAVVYAHPFRQGGVETHVLSVLRRGDRERFDWVIFGEASEGFAREAEALGARIVSWRARHAGDLSALFRLIQRLREHHVDLVHAHSARAHLLGRAAAAWLGVPLVATIHMRARQPVGGGGVFRRLRHAAYGRVEGWLARRPGRIVHVSAADHADFRARAAGQAVFIENGVDLDRFRADVDSRAVRARLGTPPGTVVLACVARLDPQKGLDVLLDAAARLVGRFELWMVGEGALRGPLAERAGGRGLDGRVRWLGARDDVPELLLAADVFVLPSRFETTSIALLEAMAAGLPVVTTDVGDSRRLAAGGDAARIVPAGDADALAAHLQALIDQPGERACLAAAARQEATRHSDVQMVARLQAVYDALAAAGGRA